MVLVQNGKIALDGDRFRHGKKDRRVQRLEIDRLHQQILLSAGVIELKKIAIAGNERLFLSVLRTAPRFIVEGVESDALKIEVGLR